MIDRQRDRKLGERGEGGKEEERGRGRERERTVFSPKTLLTKLL